MEYFKMFLNEADYTLFKSKQKKRGKFENNTYYIFSQNIFNWLKLKRLNMDEEEDVVGCIGCMSTSDLCDLFVTYGNNELTYAQMLTTCFDIKVCCFFYFCNIKIVLLYHKNEEESKETLRIFSLLACQQSIVIISYRYEERRSFVGIHFMVGINVYRINFIKFGCSLI